MRTIQVTVHVPARGEPPRRSYHNPMLYDMDLLREPRPYREAHSAEVEVLGVPVEVSPRQVKAALQHLLENGRGFAVPVDFALITKELARMGLELNLEPQED